MKMPIAILGFLILYLPYLRGQTVNLPKSAYTSFNLPAQLNEASGIIFWNNLIWLHNDDSDKKIYGSDVETGDLMETIEFPSITIQDWEELQQDSHALYLGDFGNNYKGNRSNLRIYKIDKQTKKQVVISFSYAEQETLESQKPNTTDFDCEAFLVTDSLIYLFTKQWKTKGTSLYTIPNKAGTHIARKLAEKQLDFMITGVAMSPDKQTIAFCGYTPVLSQFMAIVRNFKEDQFLDGDWQILRLKSNFIQVEGITFIDDHRVVLCNEEFKKALIHSSAQIQVIDILTLINKDVD